MQILHVWISTHVRSFVYVFQVLKVYFEMRTMFKQNVSVALLDV